MPAERIAMLDTVSDEVAVCGGRRPCKAGKSTPPGACLVPQASGPYHGNCSSQNKQRKQVHPAPDVAIRAIPAPPRSHSRCSEHVVLRMRGQVGGCDVTDTPSGV